MATFLDPAQRPARGVEHAQYRLHRNAVDDPGYRRFLQPLASAMLQRLPAAVDGLDFGCGPGPALAAMLRAAGHSVALYDPLFAPDPKVLEREYDFISCSEVVEHLHQPAVEFARLGQMLKPGGLLGIMTCFQTDDAAFAGWHYRRDPTHVVFYRSDTFAYLAHQHGWQYELPCPNVALLQKGVA